MEFFNNNFDKNKKKIGVDMKYKCLVKIYLLVEDSKKNNMNRNK